ncbi:hypothetical protein VTO73DRAFT_310 [Trametes versicolor]
MSREAMLCRKAAAMYIRTADPAHDREGLRVFDAFRLSCGRTADDPWTGHAATPALSCYALPSADPKRPLSPQAPALAAISAKPHASVTACHIIARFSRNSQAQRRHASSTPRSRDGGPSIFPGGDCWKVEK